MTDIVALGRPHPRESPLPLAQEREPSTFWAQKADKREEGQDSENVGVFF